jgi:hypothetical protein
MMEEGDVPKSAKYLLRYLAANEEQMWTVNHTFSRPDWHQYRTVLVDDNASANGMGSYDEEIDIKPYGAQAVRRQLYSGLADVALLRAGQSVCRPMMETLFPAHSSS